MNTFLNLLDKIERAKQLDFGNIFDSVLEMYKKVWLKGFLVILFVMVSAIGIAFLFELIGLSSKANYMFNDGFNLDTYTSFYYTNILYSIPQTILISTVNLAFVAAFYRICKSVDLGENATDDYLYFFKKIYFSKILMLGIIYSGIAAIAQLMLFIPYIYVYIPLAYFAIIFSSNPDLSEVEIVKASFKLGNKKWFITFGTMFVAGLLGMLGIVACGIGLLFTISIVYLPVFFIYKQVVGFNNNSEIEKIGIRDNSDY
ncbi:hypothetical protein A8C32_08600 [Flavivirga aquatica]|uniref:Beta-carotene 15,15'-monooxygenase n=1 Tax=Flavivirga aquatica TaxID=1849968 RepID=A0A1E5SJA9_9FLAO|nr:hypothetical protein [Flavivirga aquatica]OEJ99219.1 hypothetical protein A8C32_08600 [Flavivirga aquatica]